VDLMRKIMHRESSAMNQVSILCNFTLWEEDSVLYEAWFHYIAKQQCYVMCGFYYITLYMWL
jgi:hypothetical protein